MEKLSKKPRRSQVVHASAGVAGDASLLTGNGSERLRLVVVDDADLSTVTGGALSTADGTSD